MSLSPGVPDECLAEPARPNERRFRTAGVPYRSFTPYTNNRGKGHAYGRGRADALVK
jgi:hypothetical protein